MGTNYYLDTVFGLGEDRRTIYRECHIGKNNWLNIIDICRFFKEILSRFENTESITYVNYLEQIEKKTVKDKAQNWKQRIP